MKASNPIKEAVKKLLASRGYVLMRTQSFQELTSNHQRLKQEHQQQLEHERSKHEYQQQLERERCRSMVDALRGIAKRGHLFNTVIDIGASDGSWSLSLLEYYPTCQYLLVEAQPVHEEKLKIYCNEHGNSQYVLAAAGEERGQIYFDATEPFGGQASYTPYPSNSIQVPVTTIDYEVRTRSLKPPYLMKLDTHGFEVPILKGALKTLADTEVVVMECYNFRIAPECLLFFEMCEYLAGFGFRCIDLVEPLWRPYDGSFWQMDLVFIRNNRTEFAYRGYS
jgi:FkbM family methyltransferase